MPAKKVSQKIVVATIDLGAHSARMLLAELDQQTQKIEPLDALEVSIPLGSNVFQSGKISNSTVQMLCDIFKNFRKKMMEYGVVEYRAIGTSAVREAENSSILLERIFHTTGIRVQVFQGADEARLDYLTVTTDIPKKYAFTEKSMLIANIGTGACQVSSYEQGRLCFTETIKVGTMRVLEFLPQTESSLTMFQYLTPVIDKSFSELQHIASSLTSETIIAMGASVRALMRIFRHSSHPSSNVISISKEHFDSLRITLSQFSLDEICIKYQVAQDLAETMVPCFIIIDNLFRITGASTLLVPMASTRYALLQDFTNQLLAVKDYFEDQVFEMIKATALKYRCLNEYTMRVVAFSEVLFQKTATLHGLGDRELKLLKIAAYLHKAGLFINNQAYHKHSYYIIANIEIPGLSAQEHEITALIARYHRKASPRPQHPEYMLLSGELERSVLIRLASLLRVACALASQSADASSLQVRIENGKVIVSLHGTPSYLTTASLPPADADFFNYAYATTIVLK